MNSYRTEDFLSQSSVLHLRTDYHNSHFVRGKLGASWTIIDRMLRGRKIIVPGDGTSLWVLTWNVDFCRRTDWPFRHEQCLWRGVPDNFRRSADLGSNLLEAFDALGLEPNIIHVPSELIAAYWPHAHGSLIGTR